MTSALLHNRINDEKRPAQKRKSSLGVSRPSANKVNRAGEGLRRFCADALSVFLGPAGIVRLAVFHPLPDCDTEIPCAGDIDTGGEYYHQQGQHRPAVTPYSVHRAEHYPIRADKHVAHLHGRLAELAAPVDSLVFRIERVQNVLCGIRPHVLRHT